jgi:hypothetical protein
MFPVVVQGIFCRGEPSEDAEGDANSGPGTYLFQEPFTRFFSGIPV